MYLINEMEISEPQGSFQNLLLVNALIARGGNFHIYWYGTCLFGVPFFEQEINFGVSFLVRL